MNHRDAWEKQKQWLQDSIDYLRKLANGANSPVETTRLLAQADGLRRALSHMQDTERIYNDD